jgi:hypothetical protein
MARFRNADAIATSDREADLYELGLHQKLARRHGWIGGALIVASAAVSLAVDERLGGIAIAPVLMLVSAWNHRDKARAIERRLGIKD